MGLDMYLEKEIYIGAEYEFNNVRAEINITIDGKKVDVDTSKLHKIIERAGYWRKANQIHAWFVKNVQAGVDDCKKYDVSFEDLLALKKLCQEVIETKDVSGLPPQGGFFFGGTDAGEYYFKNLADTIAIIDSLKDDGSEYYYQSSW